MSLYLEAPQNEFEELLHEHPIYDKWHWFACPDTMKDMFLLLAIESSYLDCPLDYGHTCFYHIHDSEDWNDICDDFGLDK